MPVPRLFVSFATVNTLYMLVSIVLFGLTVVKVEK